LNQIPPYLTPRQIGEACGMKARTMRSLLRRAGILERIGGRWVVGESQLRERLPEVYERVYAHLVLGPEGTESDTERPETTPSDTTQRPS
jgi:hypothetical protein